MRAAIALVVLSAGLAPAQSLGSISGVVQTAATREAIAGARVTLSHADGSPLRTIFADRRGRYIFDQLPAGFYKLTAAHPYFAPARFGQKAWNKTGRPIELAPGAGLTADLLLRRWGVITGTVVDENFLGIPAAKVQALVLNPGGQSWRIEAHTESDDRGAFRLADLRPGRYYVATLAQQLGDGTGLLPTFSPHFLEISQARPVEAEVDRETTEVRIQPVLGKLVQLSGRVFNPARYEAMPIRITLHSEHDTRQTVAGSEGQFEFRSLVPGRYTLLAEAAVFQTRLAAWLPLDLERDTEGIVLSFSPAPELTIRLVDEKGAAIEDPQVRIALVRPPSAPPASTFRMERRPGGVQLARQLTPGEWQLRIAGSETYVVDSVSLDGRDALGDFPLVPSQRATATLAVSRRAARVRGRVLDDGGNPAAGVAVFCYPVEAANRHRLAGFRSARSGLRGDYRFAGLPEGDYLLFATDEEDLRLEDRIEELRPRATSVKLTAAGETVQDLRLDP